MKKKMHENSLKTYSEIYNELPKSRRRVYQQVYMAKTGITTEQIARNLNTFPHKISGRITELKADGLIVPVRKGKTESGNTCDVWGIPNNAARQQNLFNV